jgi:Fic family protein
MDIHTVIFSPQDWMEMMQELSQLDRFDAQWQAIEKREAKTLRELKSIATIRSVGASTRIEGSRMTDKEVEVLIENISLTTLTERDQQEVAGYFETLDIIAESYRDITINESSIRQLHKTLLRHSTKDGYHKGSYKVNSNRVEKTEADGTKRVIFETALPGLETEEAMMKLVEWYKKDTRTHALIKAAIFVYEFLSIHPFQDGNGRLSRLLTTLLLLKSGYSWIQYVSFEHEIEENKKEYYKRLMEAQRNRPGEDVTEWVYFFLNCLKNIQKQLLDKLAVKERMESIGVREQGIYNYIENHPGASSSEIAAGLNIPPPTVKRILADLVTARNLVVHGAGRGTTYSIAVGDTVKRDISFRFSNTVREMEFSLPQLGSYLRIKKIIMLPAFGWEHPDEWSRRLARSGMVLTVHLKTPKGSVVTQPFYIFGFNEPDNYQPVFDVDIDVPNGIGPEISFKMDYPVQGVFSLSGNFDPYEFDMMLVYDQG